MTQREHLEQAQRENRVMADLTALARSSREYTDVVGTVLQRVDRLASSRPRLAPCPLLCLSIRESTAVGHYARTADGADPIWAEAAARVLADAQEQRLHPAALGPPSSQVYAISSPAASFLVFPAETLSGRVGALALGSPEPYVIASDDEEVMLRLAAQVVLVLDYMLILRQLQDAEVVDRMTGVATHRRLLDMLDYELARHCATKRRLALMLLDVEGLEHINRSFGHFYGDHILQQLAKLVQDVVRPVDLVARCGTHDFAVMLPETDAEEARVVSEALRKRFVATAFAGGGVGLSVGVAHARPDESLTPEGLLHRTEADLHEAKRQGREWRALETAGMGQTRATRRSM